MSTHEGCLTSEGADINIAHSRKYQCFLPNAARFMPRIVKLKEYLPAKQLKRKKNKNFCKNICDSEHISFVKIFN